MLVYDQNLSTIRGIEHCSLDIITSLVSSYTANTPLCSSRLDFSRIENSEPEAAGDGNRTTKNFGEWKRLANREEISEC
jgi:hypothetical protein